MRLKKRRRRKTTTSRPDDRGYKPRRQQPTRAYKRHGRKRARKRPKPPFSSETGKHLLAVTSRTSLNTSIGRGWKKLPPHVLPVYKHLLGNWPSAAKRSILHSLAFTIGRALLYRRRKSYYRRRRAYFRSVRFGGSIIPFRSRENSKGNSPYGLALQLLSHVGYFPKRTLSQISLIREKRVISQKRGLLRINLIERQIASLSYKKRALLKKLVLSLTSCLASHGVTRDDIAVAM